MTLYSPRGGDADEPLSKKQKTCYARLQLMCEACGHEWKARNNNPNFKQCSKCRSRSITQVIEEDVATPDASPVSEPLTTSKGPRESRLLKDFDEYLDDPEVHTKTKELQIARLERQIAEERGIIHTINVIERVVAHQKAMVRVASEGKLASIGYIEEECPWCGGCSMRFEVLRPSTWGWGCHECGKVAES